MSGADSARGLAESAARPSFPTAALAAELLETCAAAAAVGSAIELGVVARVAEGPVDPTRVAVDCGLKRQAAETLLVALAATGLLTRADDGRFHPAFSNLTDFAELLRPWMSLGLALRGEWRPADAATTAGAEVLYPNLVCQLGMLFRENAEQAAGSTFRRWLDEGGFEDVCRRTLVGAFPLTLITAERR